MGNTLSASIPAEILPVESYLAEFADFIESLGSTRFMKVARARNSETGTLNVYKVFQIQDESLDLKSFRNDIDDIATRLEGAPNCISTRVASLKPARHAILERPYMKHTLCDRLSTRPFVNSHEKLWYVYQIFRALAQCQKANVCHGDLKSQNIVLSSSNWLQITDFASFKPTFLPYDNPSSFTFFFDASRRQSCYIAPERLLSSVDFEAMVKHKGQSWLFGSLKHSMDMFSVGCVIYELLCEGKSPFNYGSLCSYRNMNAQEADQFILRLLNDVPARYFTVLKLLLNRDPSVRGTAQQVIDESLIEFPPVLIWFFNYLNLFRPKQASKPRITTDDEPNETSVSSVMEPDDVLYKLKRDEDIIWEHLEENEESRPFAVLIISLIMANLRALKSAEMKVTAMKLLVRLSTLCDSSVSLERILPFLVYLLNDHNAIVRASAIHSIVDLTKPVDPVTAEQSLVFIDYLLPEFSSLVERRGGVCKTPKIVLMALAQNLGAIAQTSQRFHAIGQGLRVATDDESSAAENLADAQQAEHDSAVVASAIKALFIGLCDLGNTVRQCVVSPKSINELFKFFSQFNNSGILLEHLVTFLNAKTDWQLRAAFYDALPVCAQKKNDLPHLKSLLYHGLYDFEEFVIIRVLNCICILIAADFLDKAVVYDFMKSAVPFLAHPNDWIRICVVNLVVLLDSRWSLADVHSKLMPCIRDFLKTKLVRLNHKVVVFSNLKDPIPREIWKKLISMNVEQTNQFMGALELCRKQKKEFTIQDPVLARKFGDLIDLELATKIGRFSDLLVKMADFRRTDGREAEMTHNNGIVDLSSEIHKNTSRHVYKFSAKNQRQFNNEWQAMDNRAQPINTSTRAMRKSACGIQLQDLLSHKESVYLRARGSHHEVPNRSQFVPCKITGTLISHLHEHSNKITQLALHSDGEKFASASLDGTVKIWSVRSVIGECYAGIRSDASTPLTGEVSPVYSIGFTKKDHLVMAHADGRIVWTKPSAPSPFEIDSQVRVPLSEGSPEQIHTDGNLVFVRTHHGVLYCLDWRVGSSGGPLKRHEAWRREVSAKYGLVCSMCVDPLRANWMVLGDTNRQLLLWDLRFQKEVVSWDMPCSLVPRKLWANPLSTSSDPEIFTAFSVMGDVTMYQLSQATPDRIPRKLVLWSALSAPLDYDSKKYFSACRNVTDALVVCPRTGFIFTGDRQGSLRKWNPYKSTECMYLSGPRKEGSSQLKISYDEKVVEEAPVIYEVRVPNRDNSLRPPVPIEAKASSYHRTAITDILSLGSELLATSAADGVIKIWK